MSPTDYLTPPELAKIWRCHPSAVIALIRRGELKAFTLSPPGTKRPHWRIRKDAVAEFEKTHRDPPPSKQQAKRVYKEHPLVANAIKFF
jgi:hypothetical protein